MSPSAVSPRNIELLGLFFRCAPPTIRSEHEPWRGEAHLLRVRKDLPGRDIARVHGDVVDSVILKRAVLQAHEAAAAAVQPHEALDVKRRVPAGLAAVARKGAAPEAGAGAAAVHEHWHAARGEPRERAACTCTHACVRSTCEMPAG